MQAHKLLLQFFLNIILILTLFLSPHTLSAENAAPCEPHIKIETNNTSLLQTITQLSTKYDFELNFPASLDKHISLQVSGTLENVLNTLTSGMSLIIYKTQKPSCTNAQISEVHLLPNGTQPNFQPTKNYFQNKQYVYIDDMKKYVQEVLNGERSHHKKTMSPSQKKEYLRMKKLLNNIRIK